MKLILKCESAVFGETIHVRVRDLGEEHETEGGTALSYTEKFTLQTRDHWRWAGCRRIYLLSLFLLLPFGAVKSFVSLQFLNPRTLVGLLGRGNSPSQGRYL
jgi:hypothetical protein